MINVKILCSLLLFPLLMVGCSPSNKTNKLVRTVTNDLCNKKIVMLGENGFHGGGKSFTTKAQIIQKLVHKCNFNVILFEASYYDLEAVQMKVDNGEGVSTDMLSSALGGKYNGYQELSKFINFVSTEVMEKRIRVGGLDDQLGTRGAFYSLTEMEKDLTSFLNNEDATYCAALIHKRIFSSFPKNDRYSKEKRKNIIECLNKSKIQILSRQKNIPNKSSYLGMIANIERAISRDFLETDLYVPSRDYSMYVNVKNFLSTNKSKADKIIIWSTNTHIAKTEQGVPGYLKGKNLGAYLSSDEMINPYIVGLSSLKGESRLFGNKTVVVPLADSHSIEHKVYYKNNHPGYMKVRELEKFKNLNGSLFNYKTMNRKWSQYFDAILIFDKEYPAKPLNQ